METLSPLQDAAATAIRLALGTASERTPRDWSRVLSVARAERMAVVGWLRSGEYIRATAPREVVASWRATALRADDLARVQWSRLCELVGRMERAGLHPVVLKGVPLATRLYGDAAARASCDIDLYLPVAERAKGCEIASGAGWRRWIGEAPWDEAYTLEDNGRRLYLELHSVLTGETLAHCGPLAVTTESWQYKGGNVHVIRVDALPVYLAANLAKHVPVPLLSYLDLATLWQSLDDGRREAAFGLAKEARLKRCLAWALRQAATLLDAGSGNVAAVRRLGVAHEERRTAHGHARMFWLADSPLDATRVLGAWIWPRATRSSLRLATSVWARRVRGSFSGKVIQRRSYPPETEYAEAPMGPSIVQRVVESNRAAYSQRPWNSREEQHTQ